ncbi:acyltransferase family protein [Kribbella sp. NPDC051587]|uniref:acyltransferase family protein n=1 Tax=Kribbella sp. NPDC051587 TaxID=3364119 RepID=UPI00378F1931
MTVTIQLSDVRQARPNSRTPLRLYEIDLLRILAAGSVLLYHYLFAGYFKVVSPLNFGALNVVARYGYLGVDLFFVISGFVVSLSAWNRTPRSFVVSRITRLYPAYWAAVSITAAVSVLFGAGRFPIGLGQYLANLTMFNSLVNLENVDVVYWTLWAELRFYAIVLVLTTVAITPRRVSVVCWTWLGLTALLELGVLPPMTDLVINTQFSHYFIAGMTLSLIYRFGSRRSWLALVGLCLVNALYRGRQFAADIGDRYHTTLHVFIVVAIIIAIFGVMLAVALRITSRLAKPWYAAVGALTYPLYLLHAQLGFIAFERFGDRFNKYLLLVATTALVVGLAYLVHRYVERPLAPRLKRALQRLGASSAS